MAGQGRAHEPGSMKSYDDLLLRVEQKVPGFGGMFLDQDGRLAVYLLDVSQLGAARSAIEAVFGAQRIPAAGVRAIQGQYTVSQLKRWAQRAGAVLEIPGVSMVDLDEAKNRVTITLEDKSVMPKVERALAELGIPRAAVLLEVTGPLVQMDRSQSKKRSGAEPRRAPPGPR